MACPIHTRRRHPRICRFCRADARRSAPPVSRSERPVVAKARVVKQPRCRLSPLGLRRLHGGQQRYGVVVGESLRRTCWRIKLDGRRSVTSYRKDYIEIVGDAEAAAA